MLDERKMKNSIPKSITTVSFDKKIYSVNSVKRAVFNYLDSVYSKIFEKEDSVIVELEVKDDSINLKKIIKELYNLALQEEVRIGIECETKNIRELIYEKAINIENT